MKINDLSIHNFRGIQTLEATNLGETIIIAGQNGSGKSCIFDAIRLLKSTYGGYQQNEWQHFFGEFAIQLHGSSRNLTGLFNDSSKEVLIEANFCLRDEERSFVSSNASDLLEEHIWQILLPEAFQYGGFKKALFSAQFRDRQDEVHQRGAAEISNLQSELAKPHAVARIKIRPDGFVETIPSILLSVLFSNYRPRHIGVIDFHGAQRHYGREIVQGINLSLEQTNQNYGMHTLYNYNNKYSNVKSEMASNFVKEMLAEKAEKPLGNVEGETLSDTLKELFESFFPEKTFLGPQATADGSLSFPVTTPNGGIHDLDELSSGEKEILYGYLRIRSSAPRNSIILLDEPELHLNPRLIRGLPEFYRKHLGEALQNQLWLVTHSDALIREAVGKPGFNVFHMLPCGADDPSKSQLRPLSVTEDLDMLMADLVGDLAAYRPGGKGLIFEGGGDSDFDKTIASTLFPEELRGINLLSGTNKSRVKLLHEVLEKAYSKGDLSMKFYAVTDGDTDEIAETTAAVTRFQWDVYHIENYLLHDEVISEVLNALSMATKYNALDIENALTAAAREVVPEILEHRLRAHTNGILIRAINLGFQPGLQDPGHQLYLAAQRSADRVGKLIDSELSDAALLTLEKEYRRQAEESLVNGTWRRALPGRQILKRFAGNENVPVTYEVLRNLIVSRMVQIGYKPEGMQKILEKIATD